MEKLSSPTNINPVADFSDGISFQYFRRFILHILHRTEVKRFTEVKDNYVFCALGDSQYSIF